MLLKTEQIRKIRREKDFSQDYMAEVLGAFAISIFEN